MAMANALMVDRKYYQAVGIAFLATLELQSGIVFTS